MNKCSGNINNFCYVCGKFVKINVQKRYKKTSLGLSKNFKNAYKKCYKKNIVQNKWVPNSVCIMCFKNVNGFAVGNQKFLRYEAPVIWTNPGRKHVPENCYACKNTTRGMNAKKAKTFQYQAVPSVQLPKISSMDTSLQLETQRSARDANEDPELMSCESVESENFSEYSPGPSYSRRCQILISQARLDFMVSKLELSQRKSEELAKMLNEQNLLMPDVKVSGFRKRQTHLQKNFTVDEPKKMAYCQDTKKLMEQMHISYDSAEWRLFIDSSKQSLKAVLLHKSNKKPSIPIAYSMDTKESYEKMELILKSVQYNVHKWRICSDLKVVAMLCGLQGGYTKHMCFLCNWDSRFKGNQYKNHSWEDRKNNTLGQKNITKEALVPRENILMPLLHIKLGVVKNFIKAVVGLQKQKKNPDHALEVLNFLRCQVFQEKISVEKLKEGK